MKKWQALVSEGTVVQEKHVLRETGTVLEMANKTFSGSNEMDKKATDTDEDRDGG